MASPTSAEAINRLLNSPNLSPREKVRLREQAIKAGVKGTSLHLGSPTPEVIAQLEKSASQQKFSSKKADLDRQVAELKTRGVVLGNSSTRPELTQITAKKTFAQQQAATKILSQNVRTTLDSPEFLAIKQAGTKGGTVSTQQQVQDLLNRKNLGISTFQRGIITEVAQRDIQGTRQTEENISRILNNAGFRNAGVKITESDQGVKINTGVASEEVLKPIIDAINNLLGSATSAGSGVVGGIDTGGNIDFTHGDPIIPEPTQTGISIIDSLMNFIKSPVGMILFGLVGFVIILSILGKPMKIPMKVKA